MMVSLVLKIITIAILTQITLTQRFGHRSQGRPQFNQPFQPPPFQQSFHPQFQQPFQPGRDFQQPFNNHQQPFQQPGFQQPFHPNFQQHFQPNFQQQLPSEVHEQFYPQVQQSFPCQSVTFVNRTEDGWHGKLTMTPSKDSTGARIELTFDEAVVALVNNFGHSSSKDSRLFIIEASEKKLTSGKSFDVDFFVKSPGELNIPVISAIKLNNEEICSDAETSPDEDTSCAKFEMIGNGTGGRWDGVLTIYTQSRRKSIQVDINLDSAAWALGNDLGETKTLDQKHFSINSQNSVQPGMKLPINFFVKYDEFGGIPSITSVYVDGVRTCVTGEVNRPSSVDSSGDFTTEVSRVKGIRLTDLPFQRFPNVTLIPDQVNNFNVECGASGGLRNRFTGGAAAETDEFPFHVAVFRDQLYRCGGSLISSTTVVTAGHCVVKDTKEVMEKDRFRLLFGSIDLKTLTGNEALREIEEIIKHPEYEHNQILKQDIALLIIRGNLQFTSSINPICLFNTQESIVNFISQRFTVLGFGSSEASREPSRFLNHGKMSIITRQQCIESKLIFGLLPEISAFCAKASDNMSACPGDSGGGLIFTENGKYFLRGISSVSITEVNQQCDAKQAVAFTDLLSKLKITVETGFEFVKVLKMIVWLIAILLSSIILWDFLARDQRKVRLARQFNGPLAIPILGNFYMYLNKKPEDILPFSTKLFKNYGDTFRIWAGQRLVIVTTNPRYFEIVLSSQRNLTKNNMYEFLTGWLGTGLLISSGKKWHNRRKIITPTFHFKILQQFVDVFNHQNEVLVKKLNDLNTEKTFDIYNLLTLMSLDIISQTAMGVDLKAQFNQDSEYVKAVKEISYIITERMMNFWQRNNFIFGLTKAKKRHDHCLNVLHSFTREIVEKRRETILNDDELNDSEVNYLLDDNDVGMKKKLALLDVLLRATVDGRPLSNSEIAEEVDTFMFEGHDTVTSAITFCLYSISQNPEVQSKVYEEVTRIVGNDLTVHPTYNQLQEMKYIEYCIKETLRLYPSVPMYGRNLDEDINLDGKIVPAGSNFNIMIYNINKDPNYFKDPEKFIPERFSEMNERNENPFVYVPFSAGPRNCIGQKFAILELKSTVCNIIRNFELIPSDIELKLLMQLTLKSSTGTHVGFKTRKKNI